jgi:hypothetical protein
MFRLPESHKKGVTSPENGFLEAETYVGVFKRFKKHNFGFF